MSTSVGRVDLDLGLNNKSLQKEIRGIGSTYKKDFESMGKSMGKSIGGTFSVTIGNMLANALQSALKGIKEFVTSSIELGSSIAELENVTSTVFPTMSAQLEAFSKTALKEYGLTEMQVKKMMGTFGAMSQSFNYTETEAYAMSKSLTGLVGDVASFYNLDHDVAYTKIKSVFTGETESLKELGIVMTQTALDEFAMRKGMGKTVQQMTEQEKVALRLAFVTEKLNFASGDFNKTQNQWANQTRILQGQWDSFKASLGQSFIAVLTPVIQGLNKVMEVVAKLAEKFRDFIFLVTGQKSSGSGAGSVMTEIADVTTAAGDTAEAASDKASSAAKQVTKSLMGFDKLNKLSPQNSSSGSSGGGTSSSTITSPSLGNTEAQANSVVGSLDGLKKKLEEIAKWTGADQLWESISTGAKNFVEKQKPIFEEWKNTVKSNVTTAYQEFGQGVNNIVGSLRQAITNNKEEISGAIENLLTAYSNAGMSITKIYTDTWRITGEKFNEWTVEHKEDIDEFFNGIIETSTEFANQVATIVDDIFSSINSWWESDGMRIYEEVLDVLGDIIAWVLKLWNTAIKPIVDKIGEVITDLWNEHLKPLWDSLLDFFTSLWDFISMVWDAIEPLVSWIIDWVGPALSDVIGSILEAIGGLLGGLIDAVKGIFDALGGLLDFITGVFTGDWEKAWNGIKKFFKGIWDAIWGIIKGVINFIIGALNALWSAIYQVLRLVINAVGKIVEGVGSIFGQDWGWEMPPNAPKIPYLAEGGYVRANQPQVAVIGDNKRHGEIVAPEDKLYAIVSKALQAFMGQLITALNSSNTGSQKSNEMMQLIIQLGEETIINRVIKMINAESRRQGTAVIKI